MSSRWPRIEYFQMTSGVSTLESSVSAKAAAPRISSTQMRLSGSSGPRMERLPSVDSAVSDAASAWKDCSRCVARTRSPSARQLEPL